jgi:hypothetical protein
MQFYRIRQLRETKGVNQYLISRIEALLTEIVNKIHSSFISRNDHFQNRHFHIYNQRHRDII